MQRQAAGRGVRSEPMTAIWTGARLVPRILGVSRSIGDEPFLISHLVRVAIDGLAVRSARRRWARVSHRTLALARLQAQLLDELAQPLILHAMNGERASVHEMLRRLSAGEVWISALGGGSTSTPSRFQARSAPGSSPYSMTSGPSPSNR